MEQENKSVLDKVFEWLDERVGIYGHTIARAPKFAFRLDYWLGSFVLASFVLAVITGALVALYYIPTDPYASTTYLISNVPLGALLFSIHTWSAYAMIFFILLHMTRNFIVGAYRRPREVMWMVGVILGGLALTEAYLGYSLPYNIISWTATTTGLNLFSYMPFGMDKLIKLMTTVPTNLPGVAQGVDPLVDRFFIFHWIVGGLIMVFIGFHLSIFEKHGGVTPPPSKEPRLELLEFYKEKLLNDPEWKLQPYTRTFGMILMTFFLVFGSVILIASLFPYNIAVTASGVEYTMLQFNPALAAQTPPIPDWYFLFIYFFYKSVPPIYASIIFLVWILVTLMFPFIDEYIFRHKASHPVMRPSAIGLGVGFILTFIVNSIWAYETPGKDIGPIGIMIDGIIFLVSYVIIFMLLRKLQGSTSSLNGNITSGFIKFKLDRILVYSFQKTLSYEPKLLRFTSVIFLGLVIVSIINAIEMFLSLELVFYYSYLQFQLGAQVGVELLLLANILLFIVFGGER